VNRQSKELNVLLEEMVTEAILKEDEGDESGGYPSGIYGDYYDSMGTGGTSGQNPAHGMYKAFIEPLTDIVGSAMNVIQTLTVGAQEIFKTIIGNIPGLLVPWLRTEDYESMSRRQAASLQLVKNQYSEILLRNQQYLKDHDLWGFSFLMDPASMLGAQLTSKVPGMALGIIKLLGFGSMIGHNRFNFNPKPIHVEEGIIKEAPQDNQQIDKILSDPKVQEALKNNPEILAVREALLKGIVEHISQFMAVKSFEELMTLGKGKFSRIQQFLNGSFKSGKIKQQDIEGMKQGVLAKFKEEYRDHYVKLLTDMAQKSPNAKNSIDKAIHQIQSLK
jgi:hypothetical protein